MILYFETSGGKRKEIGHPESEKETFKLISEFLKKHNYKSHYTRIWKNEKGEICYDVGSHSEFFVLVDNDLVSRKEAIKAIHDEYDEVLNIDESGEWIARDIEEIIRCKDCKNYYPDEDGRGYHCERDSNVRFSVHKDFYCADAERRPMSDFVKDTNVPTNGCISRQAAIDAYGDWYVEEGTQEGFIGTVKQLLEGLPFEEPLTEEDYTELRDRYGKEVEFVVRDMISRKGKRWTKN